MKKIKKNHEEKKKFLFILVIIIGLLLFMIINKFNKYNLKTINTNASNLSNIKICWGIKRNDNHQQPDIGSKNKRIMDKYDAIYLGDKNKKNIYLTFDLGYEAGYMPKILEILKQNDVKAIFFITAHYLNTQPQLIKQMIDEGHIVGNHTVNHKSMPSCNNIDINKEVMQLHEAIKNKFEYEMKYIRPPKGEYSQRTIDCTNELGYKTVMWSFAYDDWEEKKQGRMDYAKRKILDNLHNGEVMLLHGTSKDNANILDEIIKEIKRQGYEFKSIDQFE